MVIGFSGQVVDNRIAQDILDEVDRQGWTLILSYNYMSVSQLILIHREDELTPYTIFKAHDKTVGELPIEFEAVEYYSDQAQAILGFFAQVMLHNWDVN